MTLRVSLGDGCTLLGPAAPPALSVRPATPESDTSSPTERLNMTRLCFPHRRGLTACRDGDGGLSNVEGESKLIQTEFVFVELDKY